MNLIQGGHYKKEGYWYRLYLNLPEIIKTEVTNLKGRKSRLFSLSFPVNFMLTSNKNYVNINFSVLGFGLGLEIQSKE